MSTHCPFYSTNEHHYEEWQTVAMAQTFEPLFFKYGVNVVVAGHGAHYPPCSKP